MIINEHTTAKQLKDELFGELNTNRKDLTKCNLILKLISGEIKPTEFSNVRKLIKQCYNMPRRNELIMCAIDQILETYGVEPIRIEEGSSLWNDLYEYWDEKYYGNSIAYYCNMGDTYIVTVIFCHLCNSYHINSWGIYLENLEQNVYEMNENKREDPC